MVLVFEWNNGEDWTKYFLFKYIHLGRYVCEHCRFNEITFVKPIRTSLTATNKLGTLSYAELDECLNFFILSRRRNRSNVPTLLMSQTNHCFISHLLSLLNC